MSIYYDIEERIAVEKVNEDNKEFVGMVAHHIHSIGDRTLSGQAKIASLKVETERKQFVLTASSSIACWAECIAAVSECESIKLFSNYEYIWRADLSDYDNVGPFELMKYAESQDDEFLKSVMYEAYNYADCSDEGCGIYCAYGYKDGHKYCGEVPFKGLETLPEGEWWTPDTPHDVQDDFADKTKFDEIVSACRNLDTLCRISEDYPNLRINDDNIEYFLNNPVIRSESDADKFAENLAVLLRVHDMDSQEVRFWEYDKMNMIKIIVNADGTHTSEIAVL